MACLLGSLALAAPASTSSPRATGIAASSTTADASARPAPQRVLKRNPLYRLRSMKSVGCAPASQVPLDTSANLRAYYESVLPCMDLAWKRNWKQLRKAGVKFRAPKVAVHNGISSSPCGRPGPRTFYCGRNMTIYMYNAEIVGPWRAYDNDYSQGLIRLAATHTLAHEYGHHLQQVVGILGTIRARYQGKLERQAERLAALQASCLGNVWLSAQRDAYPILSDYGQRPKLWRHLTVSNHGSGANQAYWADRGYASAKAGDCNAFKAPSSKVP